MNGTHDQSNLRPWIERFARFGYAAKGTVYAVVGVLAARAALGPREPLTSKVGALQVIVRQPFGLLALAALVAGLSGYVLWRFVQAIVDTERKGRDPVGLATRLGYIGNGLFYAGLALTGVEVLTGDPVNTGMAEDWTARLLRWPGGAWLVGAAGAAIVGLGLFEGYRACTASFGDQLKTHEMSRTTRAWVVGIGRIGLIARGIVFGMIGAFLIRAAVEHRSAAAGGLRQALDVLANSPFGPVALALLAAGLLAYGAHQLVAARYRRIIVERSVRRHERMEGGFD